MPTRKPRYFRVIYLDLDAQTCNVSEIMSDDTDLMNRTIELQHSGRRVSIATTSPVTSIRDVPTVDTVLAHQLAQYAYDPGLRW